MCRPCTFSGTWLKKNRSLETAASTVIQSALDSTEVEGSSQALCAWAGRVAAQASATAAVRRVRVFFIVNSREGDKFTV